MQSKIKELVALNKPVIIVDIDGVLSRYYEDLIAESEVRWGKAYDINEDHTKMWGVSYDEGVRRLQELRDDGFYGRLGHDHEAVGVLGELSRTYSIITATSRPLYLEPVTSNWLKVAYGSSISLNVHAGIFDDASVSYEQQLRTTKVAMVRNLRDQGLNLAWFIDDEPKHAGGVATELGIPTIHVRKQWHQSEAVDALPESVIRLDAWRAIWSHITDSVAA